MKEVETLIERVIDRASEHPVYHAFSPDAELNNEAKFVLMRNILLQSHFFGDKITESAFLAIGRLPKSQPKLLRALTEQVLDEIAHPKIASRDFVGLGGDPDLLKSPHCAPAAFIVSSVCRATALHDDPFAFLGILALLESTTSVFTRKLVAQLDQLDLKPNSNFVPLHATEDEKHAALILEQIDRVVESCPEASSSIQFGIACLGRVYPRLIWDDAWEMTLEECGLRR